MTRSQHRSGESQLPPESDVPLSESDAHLLESDAPLLEVEGIDLYLNTAHGPAQMLHHVGFSLDRGECMSLVGESGCGKTLTALSILGLIDKAHGTIEKGKIVFQGQNLLKMTERELRHVRGNSISMIFQNPASALNPYLRISEQLIEGLMHHAKVSEKKALARGIDWLEKVGIPDAASRIHQYPHQFSGGMLQRIMIATALMTSPALVIADEPTSALDVTIQAQALERLDEVRKESGTAIILITHDLGVVAGRSDTLAVMYAGHIVEKGDTTGVLAAPAHPYLKALLDSSLKMERSNRERLFEIKGHPPQPGQFPTGCAFAPRCPHAMEKCTKHPPRLEEIEDQHFAACFLL